jgi:26S proteasome regulatory subunit N7
VCRFLCLVAIVIPLTGLRLIEKGGDWDRRNRLKVYRGIDLISIRQFKQGIYAPCVLPLTLLNHFTASDLLIDALSTFTATELISYPEFVGLCISSGAVSLGRVDLKKKVLDSPEVNAALPELPIWGDLVTSLYKCRYDKFFVALGSHFSIVSHETADLTLMLVHRQPPSSKTTS